MVDKVALRQIQFGCSLSVSLHRGFTLVRSNVIDTVQSQNSHINDTCKKNFLIGELFD